MHPRYIYQSFEKFPLYCLFYLTLRTIGNYNVGGDDNEDLVDSDNFDDDNDEKSPSVNRELYGY